MSLPAKALDLDTIANSEMVDLIKGFLATVPERQQYCAQHGHKPEWYQRRAENKIFYEQSCAYCLTNLRTASENDPAVQGWLLRRRA